MKSKFKPGQIVKESDIPKFPRRAVWILTYYAKGKDKFLMVFPTAEEGREYIRETYPRRVEWRFSLDCYHPRTLKHLGGE